MQNKSRRRVKLNQKCDWAERDSERVTEQRKIEDKRCSGVPVPGVGGGTEARVKRERRGEGEGGGTSTYAAWHSREQYRVCLHPAHS